MRRRLTPVLMIAAAGLVASTVADPASAAPATKTIDHTIAAGGAVKIANLAGRVVLTPGANGPVKVVAVVNAEGSSPQETSDLIQAMRWVQEPDGTWNLSYPVDRYDAFVFPDRLRSMGSHNTVKFRGRRVHVYGGARRDVPVLYADLTVTVPKGAQLKVVNVMGGMRGDNLSADLTLDTGSGNVKLDGVAGKLSVDTGSGDIELRGIAGDTYADTGSGDVTIDDIAAESLKVDTGSGDVTVTAATLRTFHGDTGSGSIAVEGSGVQTFHADTGSGDVTLRGDLSAARTIDVDTGSGEVEIFGGPAFEFDLHTDLGSGDVTVGYADAELRRDRREIVGARRGSGQTRVTVDTGSGDVTVAPSAGR
jgi:hypothetical protein